MLAKHIEKHLKNVVAKNELKIDHVGFLIIIEFFRNCSDDLEAKFKQADKDGDGKLSFDEFSIVFLGLPHDVFDKADTDKDGFITLDDLKTVVPPK